MVRAGILRLIHQHMIDAAIKAKQNPFGNIAVRQKRFRFLDQIIKIQRAHSEFLRFILPDKNLTKPINRHRPIHRIHRP